VHGTRGDAAFLSLTAYSAAGIVDAAAAARLDSDSLTFDDAGRFSVTLSAERPAAGDWLPLPEGANAVWVRQFYEDVRRDALGTCAIEALDGGPPPRFIEPDRFTHRLARLGPALAGVAAAIGAVEKAERPHANQIRHWSEMQGGAAFTEPGIHYLRGAWELGPDEALVLDGEAVACRYWNVLLYSRFLNSLDYRHRTVSLTGSRIPLRDGRYRLVLRRTQPRCARVARHEGRPFGLFALRWLHAEKAPVLPEVRVARWEDVARTP
jgi:hypothetical protein